jgi:beta-glucosidase
MNRRAFLRTNVTAAAAALTGVHLHALGAPTGAPEPEDRPAPPFPKGFLFGAATSCVQIEGASKEDGKGESNWDRFCRIPGKIHDGSTPDVACDSYHKWREDIALLRNMNLGSYRFSIAWPRILPEGRGKLNQKGMDYYSRIVDALLEANIRPLATVYHWDLPQVLEDAGGWPNRETASWFADYAGLLAKHLGDRVKHWCLLNEPQAFTLCGYGWGIFAPGKTDRGLMLKATHTANLAQGLGFRAMKAQRPGLQLGIAHDFDLCRPASDSEADRAAWKRYDAFRNLWFLEPAFTGKYPDAFVGGVPAELMGLRPGDEKILKVPLDYSGINYYCEYEYVASGEKAPLLNGIDAHPEKPPKPYYPQGMAEVVARIGRDYGRPVEITETGRVQPDVPDAQGRISDPGRIAFLREVLTALSEAIAQGANVRALHYWSLLDDWEWHHGFRERIGLTYVDFQNGQKRTPKDSSAWYGELARTGKIPPFTPETA